MTVFGYNGIYVSISDGLKVFLQRSLPAIFFRYARAEAFAKILIAPENIFTCHARV